jgi:hypothetical protein
MTSEQLDELPLSGSLFSIKTIFKGIKSNCYNKQPNNL